MSTMRDCTEAELVYLAKQSDPEAFAELIRRARPVCLTVARSVLGSDSEAEDQVQIALLKAWRNLSQFRADASFTSWMCRIVTNECLMLFRKRARGHLVALEDLDESGTNRIVEMRDPNADPEAIWASEEVGNLLTRELQRIPAIFRTVLELAEIRQLSIEEVSRQLGISVAATKSRLIRARRELRSRMQSHGGRMGLGTLVSQRCWLPAVRP